jgi:hypothetical protein
MRQPLSMYFMTTWQRCPVEKGCDSQSNHEGRYPLRLLHIVLARLTQTKKPQHKFLTHL